MLGKLWLLEKSGANSIKSLMRIRPLEKFGGVEELPFSAKKKSWLPHLDRLWAGWVNAETSERRTAVYE